MAAYLWMQYNGAVINTEIHSMSFGQAREFSADALSRSAAVTDLKDIFVNLASSCPHLPSLISASANGERIPKAVISLIKKDRKGNIRYYIKFLMKDVFISKIDLSNDQTAVIALNFDKIEQTYSLN
jgi:type VI protein secretion system component Hcp